MPNLGSPVLNFIEDIGVTFLPYLLLLAATFAAGMLAWWLQQKSRVTWEGVKQEATREAVAATEQAVGQADKDGKFAFAKALLEAKVGKIGYAEAVSLIESEVLRLKAQFAAPATPSAEQAVSVKATSESAKPILAKIAAPTTSQRLGADERAI